MVNNSDGLKKKLVETIKLHPEGLTIQDLSRLLGAHRQTITKYILFLEGAGTIYRRRIGSATLHYLKAQYLASILPDKQTRRRDNG